MSRSPTTEGLASLEAEHAVLGAVLADSTVLPALGGLTSADFSTARHRRVFEVATALAQAGTPIDLVTVGEALESAGQLQEVGGLQYLAELADNCATTVNAGAYAGIILEKSARRRALAALDEARAAIQAGTHPPAEVAAELANRLSVLGTERGGETMTMEAVVRAALNAAKSARDRRKAGGVTGAPFGIPGLDNRIGGLHGPRLVIIAGRPGVGKTALAQQFMLNAAAKGFRIGLVSLEMSAEETGMRAMACRIGLNSAALARGDGDEFEALKEAVEGDSMHALRSLPICADFSTFTLSGVIARISQLKNAERIDVAIVDHIGLVEADGFSTRNDQLGAISRSLKKLAKRLDMPIVALSQLSRGVEKERRRPALSDLRDSGNIEQDADIVIALHAEAEASGPNTDVEIGLLKLRDGVKGWLPHRFQFQGQQQRFVELAGSLREVPRDAQPPARRGARRAGDGSWQS